MATVCDTMPDGHSSAPPRSGRHGRYEVRGVLGSGAMGIVLEGYDPDLQRRVAIKLLHPEISADVAGRQAAERLIREARAMARLAHPNVVPVYEVGWSDDQVFLVMELVDGVTLRMWLADRPHSSWRDIAAVFVAAGRGLDAAHKAGMIHRDFKPENVLIGSDGRPRVTDFGLVADAPLSLRAIEATGDVRGDVMTRGTIAGTPAYMSPEQWNGGQVGPSSDQFAFCVALWEALSGERPFSAEESDIRAAVGRGALVARGGAIPRSIEPVLRRGLAIDPQARWPALAEMLDEIERRSKRSARRWRRLGVTAALGAAVASTAAWLTVERAAPANPCPSPDARIAAVWDIARRAKIAGRLGPKLDTTLNFVDAHLRNWQTTHGEACRATRVRGEQSGY